MLRAPRNIRVNMRVNVNVNVIFLRREALGA